MLFEIHMSRNMCQAFFEAGGGIGKAPFLTRKGLIAYVLAEFAIFTTFIRYMFMLLLKYSGGNPPMQCQHDCVTLANHDKSMAVGMQFVDPDLDKNHTVAFAMTGISGGTDKIGAQKLNEITNKILDFDYVDVAHSIISDLAAKGVADQFEQNGDSCEMHNSDKVDISVYIYIYISMIAIIRCFEFFHSFAC